MQAKLNRFALTSTLLFLAACSGGGGGGGSSSGVGSDSVQLVLDTSSGSDSFAQVQVASAAMMRDDGSLTGNLLLAPQMLTVSDPSGEPEGLRLHHVAPGSYRELHLALVPGSGFAIGSNGSRSQLDFSGIDFSVSLSGNISHDGTQATWVEVHHGASSRFTAGSAGHVSWSPSFAGGPAAGRSLDNATMRVSSVDDNGIHGSIGGLDDTPVHLHIERESELFDDHGNHVGEHQSFVNGIGVGHHLSVSGVLDDHGGLRGQRVWHESSSDDGPRLLGRITDLNAGALSFGLDVVANVSHSEHSFLPTIEHVTVQAGSAPIHFSRTFTSLAFGQLQVGDLTKVSIASRNGSSVTAREIEIESHNGESSGPEIEGRVGSVQAGQNTITVLPRGNDPLVVNGTSVTSLTVHVVSTTRIEREGGSTTSVIDVSGVTTSDRITLRGTGTTSSVDAIWIRVRAN